MKPLRTIKRSDLGRLVYRYSKKAKRYGIDTEFAFGDNRRKGIYRKSRYRNGCFKRCLFNYIMLKKENNI